MSRASGTPRAGTSGAVRRWPRRRGEPPRRRTPGQGHPGAAVAVVGHHRPPSHLGCREAHLGCHRPQPHLGPEHLGVGQRGHHCPYAAHDRVVHVPVGLGVPRPGDVGAAADHPVGVRQHVDHAVGVLVVDQPVRQPGVGEQRHLAARRRAGVVVDQRARAQPGRHDHHVAGNLGQVTHPSPDQLDPSLGTTGLEPRQQHRHGHQRHGCHHPCGGSGRELVGSCLAPPGDGGDPPAVDGTAFDDHALAQGHPRVGVSSQVGEPVEGDPAPREHPVARINVVGEPQATRHGRGRVGHRLVANAAHRVAGPREPEGRRQPDDATTDHRHECHHRILP